MLCFILICHLRLCPESFLFPSDFMNQICIAFIVFSTLHTHRLKAIHYIYSPYQSYVMNHVWQYKNRWNLISVGWCPWKEVLLSRDNVWYDTLKMEATHCSQSSVNLHQTALCYVPENSKRNCKDAKIFLFLPLQFSLHLLFPLFLFFLPLPSIFIHCYLNQPLWSWGRLSL